MSFPNAAASSSSSSAPSQADLAAHPNVSFDQTTRKWTFESPDTGEEFEFNELSRTWVPVLTEEMVRAQQAAYSVSGVDETAPVAALAARESKKRKDKPEVDFTSNTAVSTSAQGSMTASKTNPKGKGVKKARLDPSDEPSSSSSNGPPVRKEPKKSTGIYITNLPQDATSEEIAVVFSKCGIILLGPNNLPRVKMYTDDEEVFKGEALVLYFKESSVELAVQVMDDTEFRFGEGQRMKVKKAEWGDGGEDKKDDGAGEEKKKEKKKMTEEEKRELHARMRKMESQLTEWDSGPESDDEARPPPSNSRLVVLKHMFTLEELEEDAALLLELKEDVRDEAESLGEVTNVQIWDKEEEGIMTVKFKDVVAARAYVTKCNGRFFAGKTVTATLHDGKLRYKRSGGGGGDPDLDDDEREKEEERRLEKYREFLEKDA